MPLFDKGSGQVKRAKFATAEVQSKMPRVYLELTAQNAAAEVEKNDRKRDRGV